MTARRRPTSFGATIAVPGIKRTRQRKLIVETFLAMRGHVSIDELAARVREVDPRIGVATIYRSIKLLVESKLAEAHQFNGGVRYEVAGDRHHHDHLVCNGCGHIIEFENEDIEQLQLAVARRHGFEIQSHRLELYGRCDRCRTGAARGSPS